MKPSQVYDANVERVAALIGESSAGEYVGTPDPRSYGSWTLHRATGAPLAFHGLEPVYGVVKRIAVPDSSLIDRRHVTVRRQVDEAVAFARDVDTIHHPRTETPR